MKVTIPEIAWHNRDPVFSADFSQGDGFQWRMATAGADSDVKMWRVVPHREGKDTDITFIANLRRHSNTVNCVRFSPNGLLLASSGDDGAMFLWHEREDKTADTTLLDEDSEQNKEHWVAYKMLRGHIEDVMDLSWSPDGKMIVSGSIDNSAIVWEVKTGKKLHLLKEHSHYVQGVTWDPLGEFLCSLSSDRSLLIYEAARGNLLHNISKNRSKKKKEEKKEESESVEDKEKGGRLFVEEGATKYFRRLDFTPDGAFLIVPAGQVTTADDVNYVTFLFSRANLKKPICHLPGPQKPVCAVRCCPVLYEYRNKDSKKPTSLPYRMVYAIASLTEVYLYDTEQFTPFCTVSDIHYACITDLAWSSNGRVLMITSYDGFCTTLTFDQDELGIPYSSQANQVNSPRLLLKTESKTAKKKKSSPKQDKMDVDSKSFSEPTPGFAQQTADMAVSKNVAEPISPSTPVSITPVTPGTITVPAHSDDAAKPAHGNILRPNTTNSLEVAVNDPVTPKSKSSPMVTDSNSDVTEEMHGTPKRLNEMSQKSSLNNKHLAPSKEVDAIKRITPSKVSEVQKNRESAQNMTVIDVNDESSDGLNEPIVTKTAKAPRRIALTKLS